MITTNKQLLNGKRVRFVSEEQTTRRVEEELKRSFPYTWGLKSIRVIVEDNSITLRGELPTFYLRQKLLSIVQRAVGSCRIRDEIHVG